MSWNHRVFREEVAAPGGGSETMYTIREVYYDEPAKKHGSLKKCDCKPKSYTADATWPSGETVEELRQELLRMLEATFKDPLERKDFPGARARS